jgi:proline dehydrogenase
MQRGAAMEAKGYSYSYDMLGEAALTAADARGYFDAYSDAIRPSRAQRFGRHPAQSRHLGEAVGAASALRGGAEATA